MTEFLLEIRAESFPRQTLPGATQALKDELVQQLRARGLPPKQSATTFTARRVMVLLRGLPARTHREPIAGAREVLAEIVPSLLARSADRFQPEPPVWMRRCEGILALYDGAPVEFEALGTRAGDTSVGHVALSPRPFKVSSATDYARKLSTRGIEIRLVERRKKLGERLRKRAVELGGTLIDDDALEEELALACEIPGVVDGRFEGEFLALPRELVIACLKERQRAFTVESGGALLPHFLVGMERLDDPRGRVARGNEWAVENHLADLRFLWQRDRGVSLAERYRRLQAEVFHPALGGYDRKAARIVRLVELLCRDLGWGEDIDRAVEAARLLKTDVGATLARQYPSLRGILGGLLAREEGYPESVWQAVYDQYGAGKGWRGIPRGRVGKVVAVADRLDTLVGLFGVGRIPSGGADPDRLRPLAQSLARILIEGRLALDFDLAAARAVRLFERTLGKSDEEVLANLRPFFSESLRTVLEREGFLDDEIDAVLGSSGSGLLPDVHARIKTLHRLRSEEQFTPILRTAHRLLDVLSGSAEAELAPERLVEQSEKLLYDTLLSVREAVDRALVEGRHEEWLRGMLDLTRAVERFFSEVLVHDDDERQRHNRLGLLQAVNRVYSRRVRLAELAVIAEETDSH